MKRYYLWIYTPNDLSHYSTELNTRQLNIFKKAMESEKGKFEGKFVEIKTTSGDIISIRKDTITSFQTSEVK